MRYEVYPPIYPYYVSIRKSLTGDTLAETSVNPEDIPLYNYAWIEFNFDDISVDVGETYYIVSYTIEDEQNGVYVWGASDSNPYPYGMEYYSTDVGNTWIEKPNVDLCFKTYGLENDPPNKPSIDGETNGKVGVEYEYTFETTDPEGLQVWYYIEWGDNTNTGWIGHYPSGEEITKSHSWSEKDTYTIRCKAKDPYEAESEWGELEVTMPMNQQSSNIWFLQFLKNHPRMFPILRQLLGWYVG